jgi:hypothetical protein
MMYLIKAICTRDILELNHKTACIGVTYRAVLWFDVLIPI